MHISDPLMTSSTAASFHLHELEFELVYTAKQKQSKRTW